MGVPLPRVRRSSRPCWHRWTVVESYSAVGVVVVLGLVVAVATAATSELIVFGRKGRHA